MLAKVELKYIFIFIAVNLLQIKDYKLLEVKSWFKTNLVLFYAKPYLHSMIKDGMV